ncbi:M14 family metallopeptidase [Plantactinospora sp. KLBMP9567]|uniref:M14 family metallopeptidase n=1 Tax=Plantactinospora sp. KLBMP9567 TaxID=3085900 RepID=UPI002981A875|nr:M14 family metallopeptidase [Plantactinospora sp. KLBMP9567]MDW5324128.1 M14 family metallopeptidase [Plantactinospora sp. KLBMP9567]
MGSEITRPSPDQPAAGEAIPPSVPRTARRPTSKLVTLLAGAAVVLASTPLWGTGDPAALDDAELSAAPTYTIGLQPAADPGPFPGSVTPTTPTITVAGERDGESTFAVVRYPQVQPKKPGQLDFDHFHTGIEIEWWLKKWAHQRPDIVDLYIVGESFSGEPIYQLTITDKSTGKDTDKPAAFFEGNRHSGEVSSAESSLWLAHHLISRAGRDRQVDRILDEKTVYIRPVNNPDGHNLYLYTAQTNRSSVRPTDNDGDGKLDEDPGEDLNGDGYLGQLRQYVGAGKGTHVVDDRDPAKVVMRSVGAGNGDYLMFSEGVDNDGDGRNNEDGVGGLDLHRNYPYNWHVMPGYDETGRNLTQVGAGEYPLSEPETRHVYTWLMSHTNIGAVNSMDTRVPMHLRGPSTCDPVECMYTGDRKLYEHFDRAGVGFTGYRYSGSVYIDYATRNGGDPAALFGHGPDFGYFQYGAVWYGDEIWNGGDFVDYDKDQRFADWERSRWCAENRRTNCFLPWTKIQHPLLGAVEVGGINPKFWAQNPSPDLIGQWAANQARFNIYLTESLPQVALSQVGVRRLRDGQSDGATHEITATVTNTGRIPTALEQAKEVKIVAPDTVEVQGARLVGEAPQFFLDGGKKQRVTLRVSKAEAESVTVRAVSVRGGLDSAPARLR